jgi:hypothetical protein
MAALLRWQSARRGFSTMPFAKSFYETRPLAFARDDIWAFTPLANVLRATGKSGTCGRMPSFRGRDHKRYVISDKASILDACTQMVEEELSFLVVVRPSISLGNVVIGVATEHKYVTHGARMIEDVGEAERSAFLSGWSLSDSVYQIMTPTDRMISVTPYDTVQSCVDLLEKKVAPFALALLCATAALLCALARTARAAAISQARTRARGRRGSSPSR